MNTTQVKLYASAFIAFMVFLFLFLSYVIVDAGHVGVLKHFGAVTRTTFAPGLHFKMPFIQTVDVVDVRIHAVSANLEAGSKDSQLVRAKMSAQYYLDPTKVNAMVDSIGTRDMLVASIINSGLQEAPKSVIAQYKAENILEHRQEAKTATVEALKEYVDIALEEKGLKGLIRFTNGALEDIGFSDVFDTAIEAKVKEQQSTLQAQATKQKTITDAEAQNEKKKLEADARAYQTLKEAEARAAAINQEGEALRANPQIIQLRTIERWSGNLPVYNGVGAVPFLNLDKQGFAQPSEKR